MIKTPTVLVLGAGASHPYGYPLGTDLVNKMVADVANSRSELFQDLRNIPGFDFVEKEIKRFGTVLRASASQSVDAFLESRSDFIDMGRCAIASELLRRENPDVFYKNNDWYHYLYNKMRDTNQFESFGASKVSIVTFNYDRSLEFFLFEALANSFQKTHLECIQNFAKIPIVHVHGRLGSPPTDQDGWKYGTQLSQMNRPNFLQYLAGFTKQIKIIHEANDDTDEFCRARGLLNKADRICFLGFGYHPTNLQRLLKGVNNMEGKKVFCCGFGLTKAEQANIGNHFPICALRWGNGDQKCQEFLREMGILLD